MTNTTSTAPDEIDDNFATWLAWLDMKDHPHNAPSATGNLCVGGNVIVDTPVKEKE